MYLELVKRELAAGSQSVSDAPVTAAQERWRDIDISRVRTALGELTAMLTALQQGVDEAGGVARTVERKADEGRAHFVAAAQGSGHVLMADLVQGITSMVDRAGQQWVGANRLEGVLERMQASLRTAGELADEYNRDHAATAQAVEANVSAVPVIVDQASAYRTIM